MDFYLLLLHLAGAATLLLWAVRMVRTGVERSQEPALRRALRQTRGGKLRAAGIGAGIAILLQSSTAVAVLAAGFAGSGFLNVGTGLAMMLGADLGSALVVQILSIDLHWLIPVLLLAGGALFFRSTDRDVRQTGRVLIGIALILLSLRMIGEATAPLRDAEFLPAVMGYLSGDFVTAFLVGAAFTWLIHSSIASILLLMTFAAQGVLPLDVGISLVLGANLGGGLIAVGLTRAMQVQARRIAFGNLLFRGGAALLVLVAIRFVELPLHLLGGSEARQLVNFHLAFNLLLLIVGLPLAELMGRLVDRLVPDRPTPEQLANPLADAASALDESVINAPGLALASATRELLRMAELVEVMLRPMMELYESGDREKIRQARRLERAVDQTHSAIKLYLAKIDYGPDDTEEARRGDELSGFAINLEYVGDIISKNLLRLAEVRRDNQLSFSDEGWRELNDMHRRVMANMQLALNVLISKDRDSARQLLEEKDRMRSAERASYRRHLKRLHTGAINSIETSDLHLETVRALKMINSLFATVAYPILDETGDLLDSRLVDFG